MTKNFLLLPFSLFLASCSLVGTSSDEQKLREENAQLKAQVQALEEAKTQPATTPVEPPKPTVSATPTVPGISAAKSASPASTGSGLNLSLPQNTATGAPGTYLPPSDPAQNTPQKESVSTPISPPPGYHLVKDPDRYSDTGCTHGLFATTPDAPWKDADNWRLLSKGMSAAEVEGTLGIQHYTVEQGEKTIWQYGKCGTVTQGFVVLEKNSVLFWSAPDF